MVYDEFWPSLLRTNIALVCLNMSFSAVTVTDHWGAHRTVVVVFTQQKKNSRSSRKFIQKVNWSVLERVIKPHQKQEDTKDAIAYYWKNVSWSIFYAFKFVFAMK